MSNDTQPEIRFPGFTEDWEQRKLGEVSPLRGGFAFKSNKFVKEGIPIVRISNILSNGSVGGEFVYYTAQEKDENYLLPDKSALLAMSGATTGKVSILNNPNNNKVYQNQRVGYFTKTKNVDYSFISTLVRSKIFLDQLNSVLVAGAQPNISSKDINVFELTIPKNIEEQKKIGNFFKQLDDTITLHQRKLDLLKETKKGFLQKMFPKNGAKVPEIRFPGFTEDWEQRKVGDFLNESRIKGSDGSVARKMTVKLWRKGVVPKEEIYSGSSATQYYIRKSGQFMYGKLDFLNQAFGIVPSELDGYESTLDSPAFDIGENMNSIFLLEYVSLTRFYKYQGNLANGSRRAKRIHVDTFLEMPIPTPSFEEQTKIGGFFKQLDDTITLHQRKLDLLKETKKGFLQKMFV
ncbi:restriction endonuclease subunit S [Enterococcus faecium]|uniref:restriction endonuclease subunit S n=1 Tax=Enterococcus faecium TaxID=1352 RepID=UPI00296ABDA0|nr:restriction endonuclease subunit S [Enterococcus faecium]MDW3624484.1 restriction endonuclease subunit S [Enterococcus faecium]